MRRPLAGECEPIKVNTDPTCPGADIRKGDSVDNWDLKHQDRYRCYYGNIPKERWQAIFGAST